MAKEKITARARTQYTDYMVKEPMELMEFLAAKMPDASRTKLKSLLSSPDLIQKLFSRKDLVGGRCKEIE